MKTRSEVLRAEGLSRKYGKRIVAQDIDVLVNRGEVVGLLGPNGAGKTTTFYMITGMIKPSKGNVFLDNENITRLAMYQRARKGIGYLAQEPSIFGKLSVQDNLKLVLQMREGFSLKNQDIKMRLLLNDLSISHLAENKGNTLSGGERRRVEIARVLCMDPDFILLDEPFAGVDPIAVGEIRKLVSQLKKRSVGVLITDHNVRETLEIVDRAYILHEGSIIMKGTPKEVVNNKNVREVYLGDQFRF